MRNRSPGSAPLIRLARPQTLLSSRFCLRWLRESNREIAAETLPAARRDFLHVRKPANCGHLSSVQEISANVGLRGGAGRTQTTCQARSHVERVSDLTWI